MPICHLLPVPTPIELNDLGELVIILEYFQLRCEVTELACLVVNPLNNVAAQCLPRSAYLRVRYLVCWLQAKELVFADFQFFYEVFHSYLVVLYKFLELRLLYL